MGKNNFLNGIKLYQGYMAAAFILLMFIGFLGARAALSIGMILFGLNALLQSHPRTWLRHTWWLAGIAWVGIYALSVLWSADIGAWETLFQTKIPILLVPLAFSVMPRFNIRQLAIITLGMGLMLAGGACYSLSFLVRYYQHFLQEYNISHLLPTPVYNDYICFSIACTLFIVFAVLVIPRFTQKWLRWLLWSIVVFLGVFLHILASKSGIIALYLFIVAYGIYLTVSRRSIKGILLLLGLPVALWGAAHFVPTLHKRIDHIDYTIYSYTHHDSTGSQGDISRLYSYDIAWRLMRENPVAGVGAGDMLAAMKEGYTRWHPQVTEERNKLIPHNEFLAIGLGCGIPAMLLFTIWVLMPLRRLRRNKESFFFFMAWFILLFQLMIEPYLEKQFGVFVYIFFLLLFRHLLPEQEVKVPVQAK